jgi:hypothetical protein
MFKRALPILIAIAFSIVSISSVQASAKKGVVVYNKSGCKSRYVVQTNMGYAILEWYGGNNPTAGDVIVGDIDSYGFKDLYNVTQDASMRVYVEDYMLGKSSLTTKFFEKFCR